MNYESITDFYNAHIDERNRVIIRQYSINEIAMMLGRYHDLEKALVTKIEHSAAYRSGYQNTRIAYANRVRVLDTIESSLSNDKYGIVVTSAMSTPCQLFDVLKNAIKNMRYEFPWLGHAPHSAKRAVKIFEALAKSVLITYILKNRINNHLPAREKPVRLPF